MSIAAAYDIVRFLYNKAQNGYITPAQFNNLAPIMQMSLINDRIGNVKKYMPHDPTPPYGFALNQKTREEIRPLLVPPTTTPVTAGVATIPDGYLYYDTIAVNGKQAQEATEDEILELNNSLIKPPSLMFPKFVLHSNGINVYPTSVTSISLSWLRRPITPIWNYTEVNDEPVYAATGGIIGDGDSHDFETAETTHLEICYLIL